MYICAFCDWVTRVLAWLLAVLFSVLCYSLDTQYYSISVLLMVSCLLSIVQVMQILFTPCCYAYSVRVLAVKGKRGS